MIFSMVLAPPAAANSCCLSTSDSKQCRPDTVTEPCKTVPIAAIPCQVVSVRTGACKPGTGTSVTPAPEKLVNCLDYAVCTKSVIAQTECKNIDDILICRGKFGCFWYGSQCWNQEDKNICEKIASAEYCGETQGAHQCQWIAGSNSAPGRCISKLESALAAQYERTGGFLPPCAYQGNCRSVNDLVQVLISIVREAFKYIGSVAFLFFVYGGITMILSFGSADKVQKGKKILAAAVVGIAISFGAYLLVDFILQALQAGGVGTI
ncbi:MAG: pilin [Candidatus Paceibacterota bacterium]